MSARAIVCVCIALDVRGCRNYMCIQLRLPSILCPFFRTNVCVSPARFTVSDIRKVRRRKNSIFVYFCIPFSTDWFKIAYICRYICDIFGHAQILTNDCFLTNSLSAIEDYFFLSLLSSEDNWWGRAHMESLFPLWVLRRFDLLRHIYVGFNFMSFCER